MIGVWLLAGSLAGGADGIRQQAEFESSSPSVVLTGCFQAEASGRALWDADPARATIHFRRAMLGFARLWQLGYHNSGVASRLAGCHLRFKEYPETIAWARRGLRFDPRDERCLALLERARAEVRYPVEGEASRSLTPPAGSGTPFRLDPILVFGLFTLGCLKCARGWMKGDRVLLALGLFEVALALGIDAWTRIECERRVREWATPTVVVRGSDAVLRSGNGTLYPSKVSQSLPAGMELKLLLRRGDWLQVELGTGIVGWIKEQQSLVVEG
jgi:hypothetical protein